MINPTQLPGGTAHMSRVRWWILGLIFLGTTLNYLDRMVMGILAPDLQSQFSISDAEYGLIGAAFASAYALGQMFTGRLVDKIGIRLGYGLALASWSVAAMLHGLARSALSFGGLRALLGVAESPAYPTAAKALAEWFPRKERAFAFGFINAGTNMGAILAAALVPWLAHTFGWQWAFVITGGLGGLALVGWVRLYRSPAEHPGVSAAELAHINSDPPEPAVAPEWVALLRCRQMWAFAVGKFLTDSMWWFYMTWFAKYLNTTHHLDLVHIGLPLVVIYLISDCGSIAGGWLSSFLIRRGWTVNWARKLAMLACAVLVMAIFFAEQITSLWPAVLVLGLVTAGHQGFSTNLYTLPSDMFPRRAVASVAGFGGMCGYFGASLFQIFVGFSVEEHHNYTAPFICVGLAYVAALAAIHLMVPRLEPANVTASSA